MTQLISDYVMMNPRNTNRAVLQALINGFTVKTGGDVVIENNTIEVLDDSHFHSISTIFNLQDTLDTKANKTDVDKSIKNINNTIEANKLALETALKTEKDERVADVEDLSAAIAQAVELLNEADNKLSERTTDLENKTRILIADDVGKSVRTIANEELVYQLIPEVAKDNLNTLKEIAAWIQEHPDDAAAMNLAIQELQALVGTLPDGFTEGTTVIDFINYSIDILETFTENEIARLDAEDIKIYNEIAAKVLELQQTDNANLESLTNKVNKLDEDINARVDIEVLTLNNRIAEEEEKHLADFNALTKAIATEATTREEAINNERETREEAINKLNSDIQEILDNKVTVLENQITTVETNINNNISTKVSKLDKITVKKDTNNTLIDSNFSISRLAADSSIASKLTLNDTGTVISGLSYLTDEEIAEAQELLAEYENATLKVLGTIVGYKVYGGVYNDYAESRDVVSYQFEDAEPGLVYTECDDENDTICLTTKRLAPIPMVYSDTYGMLIGARSDTSIPVAISGRVLVYPYEDKTEYKLGDAVCAAPAGKVSKMTREEIKEWPDRILGYVSCIPEYDEWANGIKVNGRIWIKLK